jgi:hypothetical protein
MRQRGVGEGGTEGGRGRREERRREKRWRLESIGDRGRKSNRELLSLQ